MDGIESLGNVLRIAYNRLEGWFRFLCGNAAHLSKLWAFGVFSGPLSRPKRHIDRPLFVHIEYRLDERNLLYCNTSLFLKMWLAFDCPVSGMLVQWVNSASINLLMALGVVGTGSRPTLTIQFWYHCQVVVTKSVDVAHHEWACYLFVWM